MATDNVPHETSAAARHRRRREVLADIDAYLYRIGTPDWIFGAVAEGNKALLKSLRLDYPQITERRAEKLRAKMAAHPDGMTWKGVK